MNIINIYPICKLNDLLLQKISWFDHVHEI